MVGEWNVCLEIAHGCLPVVEVEGPRHAARLLVAGRCTCVDVDHDRAESERVRERLRMTMNEWHHTHKLTHPVVNSVHMV